MSGMSTVSVMFLVTIWVRFIAGSKAVEGSWRPARSFVHWNTVIWTLRCEDSTDREMSTVPIQG